ncbi:MAG: polysaccharide deacetylase family protein [Aggregatilineales bacterium]
MNRTKFFTMTFLLFAFSLMLTAPAHAQEDDYDNQNRHPHIIYGNDPALANNIVMMVDDNVYEGNIRYWFDLFEERGIKATFFPHTAYMLDQDYQLWRDIVAAGHEIGYFTRQHQHGFSAEEFMADFLLFRDELRMILDDPNYEIRYAKPACWYWEHPWFDWLEEANALYGVQGVRVNILGPTPSINYMEGVFNNTIAGGTIISLIPFPDQMAWLDANITAIEALIAPNGQPYRITSLTNALND